MAKLLPPRPRYARERALYPPFLLFCFGAAFTLRLLAKFLPALFPFSFILPLTLSLAFLGTTLTFMRLRGSGYARAMRLRRPHAIHLPILAAAFFALLAGALLFSLLFGGTETLGNTAIAFESAAPLSPLTGLIAVPVAAILPAICEELFFRGVLCAELDRRGALRAVLLGSLCFSLIHFDLANLPAYFFAGALLTLVLYATDSLIAAILLHVLYNVTLLFLQRYLNALYGFTGNAELFLFLLILIFLLSVLLFCLFCAREYRSRATAQIKPPRRDIPRDVQIYTLFDALSEIPVLLCIALSVVGLILL